MERDFVPYELVVKLKALGFDEECFGVYIAGQLMITNDSIYNSTDIPVIKVPTFSQAFRWFREKYNLHCAVNTHTSSTNQLTYICSLEFGKKLTYEEVELACLDKLIEIVEAKSE